MTILISVTKRMERLLSTHYCNWDIFLENVFTLYFIEVWLGNPFSCWPSYCILFVFMMYYCIIYNIINVRSKNIKRKKSERWQKNKRRKKGKKTKTFEQNCTSIYENLPLSTRYHSISLDILPRYSSPCV